MNHIRLMTREDLESINEIYNQAVKTKFSTAHTKSITMQERLTWFREHDPYHFPVFVMEVKGIIAGWISLSPYRKGRKALRSTAEISYYVHSSYHRRGIGSRLMEYAITEAPSFHYKTLIAILLEPNTASIALLRKFGFEIWGNMPAVAEINGDYYNHQYYGLHLDQNEPGLS